LGQLPLIDQTAAEQYFTGFHGHSRSLLSGGIGLQDQPGRDFFKGRR
jgi:hypothetical protein